jgi:excisionase family DNA binding protein
MIGLRPPTGPYHGSKAVDEWLTAAEAQDYLKVSKATLGRLCSSGRLPCYRLTESGTRRFKGSDLDALMVRDEPAERSGAER